MPSPDSAALALLIAKIVVSVGFVLVGTAAAERLGPRLGGLIAATPQMAVVSLIFFAIEQGQAFPGSPGSVDRRRRGAGLGELRGGREPLGGHPDEPRLAHLLGPKWSGLIVAFPVNTLPVVVILHWHYGSDVIKPFIKRWPSGVFGVCLFNLVAFLCLERLGLTLTVTLAYAVDIAYVVLVGWLSRPRTRDERLPVSAA